MKNKVNKLHTLIPLTAALMAALTLTVNAAEADWRSLLPADIAASVPESLIRCLSEPGVLPEETDLTALADALSPASLWTWVKTALTRLLCPALADLGGLLSVAVLSALLEQIRLGQENGSLGKALTYVSGLCMGGAVYRVAGQAWQTAVTAMEGQTLLVSGFVPLLTGVSGAAGQVSRAAVTATGLTILTELAQRLGSELLLPFLSFGFGLSLIGGVMPEDGPDLTGLGRCLKAVFGIGLTLLMTLFGLSMTYQTLLAKAADGALLRTLRLTAGTLIPVIGGSLGEVLSGAVTGFRTVAQLGGTLSSVALLWAVLPALLQLEAARLTLALTAGVAGLLGCGRVGTVAEEAGRCLGLATALTAGMSVLFLYGIFLCVGGVAV